MSNGFDFVKMAHAYDSVPDGADAHTWAASQGLGIPVNDVTELQRAAAKMASFGLGKNPSSFTKQERATLRKRLALIKQDPDGA